MARTKATPRMTTGGKLNSNPQQPTPKPQEPIPNPQQPTPKPPKYRSAFVIFASVRRQEITNQINQEGGVPKQSDITKQISEEWRELPEIE